MSTNLPELKTEPKQTPDRAPHQRPGKLVLLLVSIVLSGAMFLILDWVHTARLRRNFKSTSALNSCRVRDSVRHHGFEPNCTSDDYWGADKYKFFTNSLGFRDEKVREVPAADARPRILLLGDSFTEGMIQWRDSYVGRIADHFPQYDFLNGGVVGYSPSNFLNTTRMILTEGIDIDEVIVFIDTSAVAQEAAFYRDIDASGAVAGLERDQQGSAASWYVKFRRLVSTHFVLTGHVFRFFDRVQRLLVRHGYYHLPALEFGDPLDMEISAWPYRKVNETAAHPAGYAPLGAEGGIAKGNAKMTLLWEELEKRNIPLSIVVYPYPAQLVHDNVNSRQVRIWREWCEGKCKRFVSVYPAFFAAKDRCPQSEPGCWYPALYVYGDIHFAAGGNALVTDAVVQSLTEAPPAKRPEAARHDSAEGSGAH